MEGSRSDEMTKKKKPNRKVCINCEKSLALSSFYASSSPFFPDGRMHMCRDCSLEIVEKEGFKGFQDLMKIINKPIYDELFKNDPGDYVRQMNSLPQYRGVTYEDSTLFNESRAVEAKTRAKPTELSEEDLRDSEDFWGIGKPESHYIWLNAEFADYLSRYEVDSKTLEDLITEICLTRLDIRLRRENNQDVDKQIKTLNDLMGSANLKPSQETGNQSVEQETFGTLIRKWEDTRPIQDDTEWRKHDDIGKYLKTWFTGHLMRMFNIENKDEKDYYNEINKYTVSSEDVEGDADGRD